MRNWTSTVLIAVAVAACHPRYATLEDGRGGSGGLDSIRVRILACLAARDYDQARFEQMISAAERGLVPFLEAALPHIFREVDGHFPIDTAEARELIQTTVSEENFAGLRASGDRVYVRILETGLQIWVYVRDGTIRNAGRNEVQRSVEQLLK